MILRLCTILVEAADIIRRQQELLELHGIQESALADDRQRVLDEIRDYAGGDAQ